MVLPVVVVEVATACHDDGRVRLVVVECLGELGHVAALVHEAACFHGLDAHHTQQNLLSRPDGGIALVLGLEVTPDVDIANALKKLLVF